MLMYELKKIGKYLPVNSLGPGPRVIKKILPGRGLAEVEKHCCKGSGGRSQLPHGLRFGSAAARVLGLWVRIPRVRGAWMFVCCECCVLSGKGLCIGLITRPEES